MSNVNKGPYNGAPKYINDFSKALAGEVRILLAEVGKLRDERRQLQYEIAELMSVKSKHGAGGEYSPEWRPAIEGPPPPDQNQVIAAPVDEPLAPARPAWRTVYKRPEKRIKAAAAHPPVSSPTPPPVPIPPPTPSQNIPAWAQWRPNPLLSAPAPVMATSSNPLPSTPNMRSGLFGPSTPPPK